MNKNKMLIGTTTGCLFGYRTGKRVKATAWKNDWKNSINRGKHANNPAKQQQTNKYKKWVQNEIFQQSMKPLITNYNVFVLSINPLMVPLLFILYSSLLIPSHIKHNPQH